ncbi:MAG: glycosyltransferase family 1 protein [bacterium]|nr:glycosyltransferase family 1 protein [bacterium]
MNIGINSRIYQGKNTGIQNYIRSLYKNILEIDKMNHYVFFQTNDKKKLGITRCLKLPNSLLGTFLFDNFLINILIGAENISILHGPAHILPFFKNKGVKYYVTIHDLSFLVLDDNRTKWFNLYYRHFMKRSLHNADVIIADSENTKKDIKKFYNIPDDKIKTVYLGVNDYYFNAPKQKSLIHNKYFFSVSTHPYRKNIPRVLDIFATNKKLQSYKFVIAGSMPKEHTDDLKKQIKKLGLENRVILYGYAKTQELISLYQNAEFFIYPSYYEGFGLPVLEAMASKCPVIASNTSSLPEIMPSKEWSFNPHDSQDINNIIDRMIGLSGEAKNVLIEKNYRFAKIFTWDKTANAMLQIFKELDK